MNDSLTVSSDLLTWATQLQAIAQTGMAYTKDLYDKERYDQLLAMATQMMAKASNAPVDDVKTAFLNQKGYATPKVDVRALIMNDQKILLVQESQDNKWSLPGGWADVNYSPSESVMKEVIEETGLTVVPTRLMTLWDTAKHDHPPHWPYIYKCVFDCQVLGGTLRASHEVLNVDFFPVDQLPELSTYRITEQQIKHLIALKQQSEPQVAFD